MKKLLIEFLKLKIQHSYVQPDLNSYKSEDYLEGRKRAFEEVLGWLE
jgi:hypothetical protein